MSTFLPAVRVDPYRSFNFLITLVHSAKSIHFGGYAPVPSVSIQITPPSPPRPPATSQPRPPSPPMQVAPAGGFSECSGLELAFDIEEYKEGGNNGTVVRFPTGLSGRISA